MADVIRHDGRVESIGNGVVSVRILQSSACSSCSAAHLCKSSETKEKIVDVYTSASASYEVGQQVRIVGEVSQGLVATWWAYVLPLIVMLIVMVVFSQITENDAFVAIAAIGILFVYYGCLYLLRDRFEKAFAFRIE